MAKNTLFGFVRLAPASDQERKYYERFRLHLGHSVDPTRDLDLLVEELKEWTRKWEAMNIIFRIYVSTYPSPGTIYERELHVSCSQDESGKNVLHLKEGPRFMETRPGNTFPTWLGLFLGARIPIIAEIISK